MINRVLALIKSRGPISAKQIAHELGQPEKRVRSCIDALRSGDKPEPVWNDPVLGAFWWSSSWKPSGDLYKRWKRLFPDGEM